MGAMEQDEECSYEKGLCKKFVEQARLNGDPVVSNHYLLQEVFAWPLFLLLTFSRVHLQ